MTVAQQTPPALTGNSKPKLAKGVRMREDKVRERTVLLAPERTIALDPTGVAILNTLDGDHTLDTIIDELAEAYEAPREMIDKDVTAFLEDLANRRLLEIEG